MDEATPGLADLCRRLDLPEDIAYDPLWSAAPDFLGLIVRHALAERPATVVECSSGATTVMLARCCAMNGHGHVWSLENGAGFAARTRAELERLGLSGHATVLDAPLTGYRLEAGDFQWYELSGLTPGTIDLLVIDGPPGFLQPLSRYPALPLLHPRLAAAATVYLDDAARPDEQRILALWQAAHPDLGCQAPATRRGCAVLRREG